MVWKSTQEVGARGHMEVTEIECNGIGSSRLVDVFGVWGNFFCIEK